MSYGAVVDPRERGYRGTFHSKAIAGCPHCHGLIDEPESVEELVLVCPHCEDILTWVAFVDDDEDEVSA